MGAEPRTIVELARALRRREVTSASVTEGCLRRIEERNPDLNAFITVLAEEARAQARDADRELAAGLDRGPLHGVPISLKDLFDLTGTPTTAASRVRAGHIATSDAVAVQRLRAAGAVIVGKTNLHEFALGTTNEESAYGPVKHPLDPTRSAGGSSGGSAASVLAGMAFASIGTDTGGSIRIPAAACGLVGLKPALGEIDATGVVPLSSTLDHVGPLCRSVEDAAIVFEVLRGTRPSPLDARLHEPAAHTPADPTRLRVAVLGGYFTALLDPEVAASFEQACARLRDAGVTVTDAAIPHAAEIAAVYLHIALSEAAAYHATTLDTRAGDYTVPVRLRLEMGRNILAEDYVRALQGRDVLRQEVDRALESVDALLLPGLAVPATVLGKDTVRIGDRDEPVRSIMLRQTQLFNITGHPAITLPCGTTRGGLPISAQLVGMRTPDLLRVAATLEPSITTHA